MVFVVLRVYGGVVLVAWRLPSGGVRLLLPRPAPPRPQHTTEHASDVREHNHLRAITTQPRHGAKGQGRYYTD
jgi:hypothetical protein